MILQALCHYAEREKLSQDDTLEQRRVDYILNIDRDGKLLGVIPTAGEDGISKRFRAPREMKRTVAIAATPLFDNATYVLGIAKGDEIGSKGDAERREKRAMQCAAAFAALAARIGDAGSDPALDAVVRFCERREENRHIAFSFRPLSEWSGSESLGFSFCDDHGLIYERPGIRAALRAASSAAPEDSTVARCLVTGTVGPVARLHPSIKRVPGGQPSGTSVVSFNAESFASHGLDQGDNAPVSDRAAILYAAALNHLLEGTPARPYRSGVRLSEDAVVVFWTREKDATPDLLASLFDPSPEQVEAVVTAPLKGLAPGPMDENRFYAMTLGGNSSRVVVRDWLETTAGEVKSNVQQYFEDLRVAEGETAPQPLWQLLKSLESKGRGGISPLLAGRLFRSALSAAPFPRELLGLALRRLRLPAEKSERFVLRNRCAVIKAVLNRHFRNAGRKELTVSLDESCREVPYLLGRLFAVLERLQGAALGDVNASIRDRFFGSAAATPALVFPRLLKLSVHHAAKADAGGWLEKVKSQIVDSLPPQRFPGVLALEDQGLFAVGYYHQRERFFRGAQKTDQPSAERA